MCLASCGPKEFGRFQSMARSGQESIAQRLPRSVFNTVLVPPESSSSSSSFWSSTSVDAGIAPIANDVDPGYFTGPALRPGSRLTPCTRLHLLASLRAGL